MYFIDVIQEYAVIKYGCSLLCSINYKQFGNEYNKIRLLHMLCSNGNCIYNIIFI